MEELTKKLSRVMKAMGNIPKRGKFESYGQRYDYITNDDVSGKLQEALVEEGILIFPSIVGIEQTEIESKGGTKGTHTVLDMMFEITDGKDSIILPWRSEALDYQDKGIGKAVTYGKKYFVINLFQIATGDPRDDSDSSVGKHEDTGSKKKSEAKPSEQKAETTDYEKITKEQLEAYEALAATALKFGVRAAVIDERLAMSAYQKIYDGLAEKVENAKKGA